MISVDVFQRVVAKGFLGLSPPRICVNRSFIYFWSFLSMITKIYLQTTALITTGLMGILLISAANAQVPNIPDSELFNPRVPDEQVVAPSAGNWKIPIFDPSKNFQRYVLPAPPANTSPQTKLEIEELNGLAATRNDPNVVQTLTRWNFDPPPSAFNDYFDMLVQQYNYSPPLSARCYAMLNQGIYSGLLAAWTNKFTYLRPRPDQVTSYNFQPSNLLPTPNHPAYPSGHSTSAGVFMAIGPSCFPNEPVEGFVALGRESSLARRQGGVHYYSDSVAGEALGYTVGSDVVRAYQSDGSPLGGNTAAAVYSRDANGTPTTTLRRRKPNIRFGPQLASDGAGKQRIVLVPITPFPAPPAVKNPPDSLIKIPPASTTILDSGNSTPVAAPPSDADPNPSAGSSVPANIQLAPAVEP
jgi:hypothetical protein